MEWIVPLMHFILQVLVSLMQHHERWILCTRTRQEALIRSHQACMRAPSWIGWPTQIMGAPQTLSLVEHVDYSHMGRGTVDWAFPDNKVHLLMAGECNKKQIAMWVKINEGSHLSWGTGHHPVVVSGKYHKLQGDWSNFWCLDIDSCHHHYTGLLGYGDWVI